MDPQQPPNKGFSSPFGQKDQSSSPPNHQQTFYNQTSSSNQTPFPTQSNQPTNQSFQMNNSLTLPKFRISKKWILVGLAVSLLIGGVYSFGAFTSQNPQDLVKEFETAVYEGNTKKLANLMVSEDPKVKIDAESLKSFTAFLKEKEEYRNDLISSLQSSATMYEQNSDILENGEYADDGGGDAGYYDDIYLYRNEIPLYYDTYEIRVRPYQVAITTNEPDTKIIVDNKELFKTTSTQLTHVATVLPGKHDVKISKSYDFWDLTTAKEIVALGEPSGKVEVEVKSEGETIELSSLFPQTKLIVNEKKTNKLVKDHQKFGPVSLDGSMTIAGETEMPWGVEKSYADQLETFGGSSYDLTPQTLSNKETRKQLTDLINNYVKQQLEAYKKMDSKVITNLSDDFKRHWTEEIEYKKENNEYKGSVKDCKIDFHKVTYSSVLDENIIEVSIPILYHQTVELTSWGDTDPPKEEFKDQTMILRYNKKEKKWFIQSEVGTDYGITKETSYMNNPDVIKTEFK